MRRPGEEQEKRVPTRLGSRFRWGPRCRADGATVCSHRRPGPVRTKNPLQSTVIHGESLSPRVRGKGAEGGVELSLPRDPSRQWSDFRGRARPRTTSAPAATTHLRTCHLHLRSPALRCLSAGAGAVPEVVEARA